MLPIGSVGMLSMVVAAQHYVTLDDYDPPDAGREPSVNPRIQMGARCRGETY